MSVIEKHGELGSRRKRDRQTHTHTQADRQTDRQRVEEKLKVFGKPRLIQENEQAQTSLKLVTGILINLL